MKQLKPSWAVETIKSLIWGWKWSSLIEFWPYRMKIKSTIQTAWTKRSWGGTSGIWSAESASSDKSQIVSCSSLETANTELSWGDHSTEVIGAFK